MIEVKDLVFSYPNSEQILKDISFSQDAGHCLALLGNNGCGKSTLLNCLDGILKYQKGNVVVCGKELHAMKRKEVAQTMAYVAQTTDTSQLTVYDTVLLGRKPYISVNPTEEDHEIVRQMLHRLDLEEFSLRYIDELSGGELQKVVLARALAQKPQVLLLDEPTSNLDLYNQHEVMRIATEIAHEDGILVVIVIHDLNLALRYCDRFMLVKNGNIYRYGDASVIDEQTIMDVYRVRASIQMIQGKKIVIV